MSRDFKNSSLLDTKSGDPMSTYLKMSYDHLNVLLKAQKKSDDEIDKIMDKVKEMKKKIEKLVRKFKLKVEAKYGYLNDADLIKKGLAHAGKYGLSSIEKELFIRHVLDKSGPKTDLTMDEDLKYSAMSRFLGADVSATPLLKVSPKDQAKLNELVVLYNSTKHLFNDLKNQSAYYSSGADLDTLAGAEFKPEKMSKANYINPLIVLLFATKCAPIENRTLKTNMARMVLARVPSLLQKVNLFDNVFDGELEQDFNLSQAVAADPNSLGTFSEDSPITNLIKRFKIQVELYKTVVNLRNGKFFAKESDEHDGFNAIDALLSDYDYSHFDTIDNLSMDEGTMLKKLLSVFSIRPTFTMLSSYANKMQIGSQSINSLARVKFINLPVINVRIPTFINEEQVLSLKDSLKAQDCFVENKMLVPKNKEVVYSKDVAFFYCDRRHKTVNFSTLTVGLKNISLPNSFVGANALNRTQLDFNNTETIGREMFDLKGLILLETPPSGEDVVVGSSAVIVYKQDNIATSYLYYNPLVTGFKVKDPSDPENFMEYPPIMTLPEYSQNSDESFRGKATEKATVWFYQKQ